MKRLGPSPREGGLPPRLITRGPSHGSQRQSAMGRAAAPGGAVSPPPPRGASPSSPAPRPRPARRDSGGPRSEAGPSYVEKRGNKDKRAHTHRRERKWGKINKQTKNPKQTPTPNYSVPKFWSIFLGAVRRVLGALRLPGLLPGSGSRFPWEGVKASFRRDSGAPPLFRRPAPRGAGRPGAGLRRGLQESPAAGVPAGTAGGDLARSCFFFILKIMPQREMVS